MECSRLFFFLNVTIVNLDVVSLLFESFLIFSVRFLIRE